jgi:16S rRNA (guanine527-N7)-methyltransferase
MESTLRAGLPELGLALDDAKISQLAAYGAAVLEQNKVMNLTAITDPVQAARLHLLDSLALLTVADLKGKRVIDVGTGAGMPGVPLKIAEPGIDLTLLDSTEKKINFLKSLLPRLGTDANCVSARAEEFAASHRECYDAAVSRAVARLRLLAELCLPLVKVGGWFYALKGPDAGDEAAEAANAVKTLGGAAPEIVQVTIPGTDAAHCIVKIQKIAPTPGQYPRAWGKMKKAPL